MPNQLIQDPNKASVKPEVSLKDIAEPISYFLSGSFLISFGIPRELADGTVQSTNYVNCIVGGFLILSGFIFSITNLPFKPFIKFRGDLKRIFNKYVYSIVFIIAIAQLIFTAIDFASYPPLFYIGFVFLILVLLEIIITIENIRGLLMANLILYLMVFFLVLTQADMLKLVTILTISFFAFIVVICRVWNKVTSRT